MLNVQKQRDEPGVIRDISILKLEAVWEAGQEFIDQQWEAAIESREVALAADLDRLVENKTPRNEWKDEEYNARCIFGEQVRERFKQWRHQHGNEKDEMDAIIKRISNADTNHLDVLTNIQGGIGGSLVSLWNSSTCNR